MIVSLVCCSGGLQAGEKQKEGGINTSYYLFGEDTEWKLYNTSDGNEHSEGLSANKSGSIKNYKHIYHYHLDVDKNMLKLRLSVQDRGATEKYDLEPDNLVIINIAIDGKRLSLFQWCLDHQKPPSTTLNHSAQVKNAACTNAKDIGEFILRLDKKTKEALLLAKNIEIEFLIDNEKINLIYSMHGFSEVMHQVDSGLMSKKESGSKASVCYLNPPHEFEAVIDAIPYSCENKIKQAMAQGFMSAQIQQEVKKVSRNPIVKKSPDSDKKSKTRKEKNPNELVDAKIALTKTLNKTPKDRAREWEIDQSVMWINRCKKRWDKGVSPCYCKKYFYQAPVGVKDSCD